MSSHTSRVLDIFVDKVYSSVIDLLSLQPNCKNVGIKTDNLNSHSGYIQWYSIQNNNRTLIDSKAKKYSIKIMDPDKNISSILDKNEATKYYHEKIQDGMVDLVKYFNKFIIDNPGLNQNQVSRGLGFDDYFEDKGWIVYTITKMLESQNLLIREKIKNRLSFKVISEKYKPLEYLDISSKNKSASRGEALIANFARSKNIDFIQQYSFPDCKSKKLLRFDFLFRMDEEDILIEYNGKQHYEFINRFHSDDRQFKYQLEKDDIKRKYCRERELRLIEIKYDEDIITRLMKELCIK